MFNVSRLTFRLESGFYFGLKTDPKAHYVSVGASDSSEVQDGVVTIYAKCEQGVLEDRQSWTPLEVTVWLSVELLSDEAGEYLTVRTCEQVEDLLDISVVADGAEDQHRGRIQIGRGGQFGIILLADYPNLGAACANYLPG